MSNALKNIVIGTFSIALLSALGYSFLKKQSVDNPNSVAKIGILGRDKEEISGIITSEKESFFKDPRTLKILEDNGIIFKYERWASGKMAQIKNVSEFGQYADFAFPPGIQTSDKIKNTIKGSQAYNIFYSPMVVATWKPIVNILDSNGLIENKKEYQALKMDRFLQLVDKKTKWKDLKNSSEYSVNKNMLISTSDARFSNSSKMYMGLTSYIYNQNEIIQTQEQADKIIPNIKQMMASQGNRESSSTNLFTDYNSIGMGKAPMIFVYESEFLENAIKNNGVNPKMQLVYPTPTMFTKHVLIGFNPKAQKLVDILTNNAEIKKVAADYGFRFAGNNELVNKAKTVGVDVPETVIDVIDPPSFDTLEYIVNQIETK